MKKVVLSALAVVFTMFMFSSCGGGNMEEDIIGVWKIETAELGNLDELVETMATQFGIEEADMEDFKVELEEGMSDEFIGETIEFVEDKTVVLNGESGEWTLEEKTFTITKDGESFDFVVESLSGDALDAKLVMAEDEMDIEITMTLARQ